MAKDTDPFDQSRERTMVLRRRFSAAFYSMESIRKVISAVFLRRRIIKSIPHIVIQRFQEAFVSEW